MMQLTIEAFREIAEASVLEHAEFSVAQFEAQAGTKAAEPLWAELARLEALEIEATYAEMEVEAEQAAARAAAP
jgi:hypothetical protein